MSAHSIASVRDQALAWISYVRKGLVNAVGMATALLALGLLPEPYAGYIASGIAVATLVLHYWIPNAETLVKALPDTNPVDGIPASQLIAEHEAEHHAAAPESPADAVESPAPTEDTPVDSGPATVAMPVEDLLAALHDDEVSAQ